MIPHHPTSFLRLAAMLNEERIQAAQTHGEPNFASAVEPPKLSTAGLWSALQSLRFSIHVPHRIGIPVGQRV